MIWFLGSVGLVVVVAVWTVVLNWVFEQEARAWVRSWDRHPDYRPTLRP